MYQTEDGATKVDVVFGEDTVWLTQEQIAELFQTTTQNITHALEEYLCTGRIDRRINL